MLFLWNDFQFHEDIFKESLRYRVKNIFYGYYDYVYYTVLVTVKFVYNDKIYLNFINELKIKKLL